MACVFAEFERGIIKERIIAGLKHVNEHGPRKGKKAIGRPKTDQRVEAAIKAKLEAGQGMLKTAKECGVGVSVVVRVKEAMAEQIVTP
jgi:DNA invertase Pin-like site-specific DNA recombinase